mmetsp:Transcript_4609/g.6550  ORF Transcript_4609/g.6550 Transcript_4609/m.6550 type:complete len:568 (-) Transcript_4609:33-1736(-)
MMEATTTGARTTRSMRLLLGFILLSAASCRGLCPSNNHQRQRWRISSPFTTTNEQNYQKNDWFAYFPRGGRQKTRSINTGGGRISSSHLSVVENNGEEIQNLKARKGMAAALFSTYFAVMGAKCALPSVLSLIMASSSNGGLSFPTSSSGLTSNQLMARTITMSTIAIALGKAICGPVIDKVGGVVSLQVCLIALVALLGIISFSQSFMAFSVCWVLVDFIFSSCWASCVSAVHQSFPRHEWGQRIGLLAAAARTGNAAAFFTFANVLTLAQGRMKQPWRLVFGVSSIMQIFPIVLLCIYGKRVTQSPNTTSAIETKVKINTEIKKDNAPTVINHDKKSCGEDATPGTVTTKKSPLVRLRQEAGTPEFWFHFISRSTNMVLVSFLLFIPSLMSSCYGMSTSSAAAVGSVFALGCLLSVTVGAQRYSTASPRGKINAVVSLMGIATLCCFAQLGHMTNMFPISPMMSAALFFLFGFCLAIPFYIPPSLYALARGGAESSATIADVFDFGGFGLLAIFNGYVASISYDVRAAWIPTFQILSSCSLISLISLTLAVIFEDRTDRWLRKEQ